MHPNLQTQRSTDKSTATGRGYECTTNPGTQGKYKAQPGQKSANDHDSFMEEYKDCFEGLGCLPGEHKIRVDKSVSPVVHPCRKIPFALRKNLKDELACMEKPEVIKKIDEPTEWVSSLVVV